MSRRRRRGRERLDGMHMVDGEYLLLPASVPPLRLSLARHVVPATLVSLSLLCLSASTALGMGTAGAGGAGTHTSLPVIERQVMCVTCKIPLQVAQSTQANRERAFIQSLIDEGRTEAQIKDALVAQYGPTVLGLPSAHGFDLTVYLVPLAAFLALLTTLAVLLPRWRRRARAQADSVPDTARLDPADAARLEADLARFD
jgi:cytochrome c-type biogenesis protein CcmH